MPKRPPSGLVRRKARPKPAPPARSPGERARGAKPGGEGGARQTATQNVLDGGRELSTAVVMFHSILAGRQGLGPTDEKALDLIRRFGPLSAGELAERSGLAAPSVTGLLNRLEAKGFVRRVPDPSDGRKVRVELVLERIMSFAPLFAGLIAEMEALCASFSVEELELVARFLRQAAAGQLRAAQALGANPA